MKRLLWRTPAFGLALAFAAIGPAMAKGISIHTPKNLHTDTFNQNCQDMGGTTDSKDKNHSRCTLPSGTTVDCANDDRGQIDTCISSREMPRRHRLFDAGQNVGADSLQP